MTYIPASFVRTADAYVKEFRFAEGDVFLQIMDHATQLRDFRFHDVLAFRWGDDTLSGETEPPRSDEAYEVSGSAWVEAYAKKLGVLADQFRHYKLCFNACDGDLDIIARISGACRMCGSTCEPPSSNDQ